MTAITAFQISVQPPRAGIRRLHNALLTHPRIRDCASELVYSYWVKGAADMTAGELAEIVLAALPGVHFIVVQLHHGKIAGSLPDAALAWLEAEPPPPRGPDYEPAADAITRLPMVAGLEYAAAWRCRQERMIETRAEGHA